MPLLSKLGVHSTFFKTKSMRQFCQNFEYVPLLCRVPWTLERLDPQIEFHPLIISLAAGGEKIRGIHHSPEVENTQRTSENTQSNDIG